MAKKNIKVVQNPVIDRFIHPIQRFFKIESSGGIVLVITTLLAMIWANSPFAGTYFKIWEEKLTIGLGSFTLEKTLVHWINDGLMVIFFFVVGLEIKREILIGELSSRKKVLLPVICAFGGMVFPALIYLTINRDQYTAHGWGIPTATDIAFAIGIMSIAGKRVPIALKVLLTALAIIDDIGAVIIIALFYSGNISLIMLGLGFVVILLLILMNKLHVRSPLVYIVLGIALWLLFLKSGVHTTIAGVILAFTIPTKAKINSKRFYDDSTSLLSELKNNGLTESKSETPSEINNIIFSIEESCENVTAPAHRIEHKLHPYVAFFIMPLFALANAGISLSGNFIQMLFNPVALGILAGLVLGKSMGISLAAFISTKLKIAEFPRGSSFSQVVGMAFVAGIGFTMSMFIASLSFNDAVSTNSAKTGIICGSLISAIIGLIILKIQGKTRS